MTTIQLRPPNVSDRDAWKRMFVDYAASGGVKPSADRIQQTWDWIMDTGPPLCCLLAEVDGIPMGFVHFQGLERPICGDFIGYVHDVFVASGGRGLGLGTTLMQGVLAEAKRRDWTNVRWTTKEGNAPANKIYERFATRSPVNVYVASVS